MAIISIWLPQGMRNDQTELLPQIRMYAIYQYSDQVVSHHG